MFHYANLSRMKRIIKNERIGELSGMDYNKIKQGFLNLYE